MGGKVLRFNDKRTPTQTLEDMHVEAVAEKWTKAIVIGFDASNARCIAVSSEVKGSDIAYAQSALQSLFCDWDRGD
jgi:hypothetical protein